MSSRAGPRSAYATPAQPFGWPTQKYQYFYKVAYPLARTGTQATMLRNMREDLLPPPLSSLPAAASPRRARRWRCASPAAIARTRGDVALAAAQSATVSVRRSRDVDSENDLYMKKVRRLLRRCLLLPGDFSGFSRSPRDRIDDTVARLHYDKFEMRKAKMAEKKSRAELRQQAESAAAAAVDALYGAENVSVLLRRGSGGVSGGERVQPERSHNKRLRPPGAEAVTAAAAAAAAAEAWPDSDEARGERDWSDDDDDDVYNDEERPYVARFPRSRDEPRGDDTIHDVSSDQLELIIKRLVRFNDSQAASRPEPAAPLRAETSLPRAGMVSPPTVRRRAAAAAMIAVAGGRASSRAPARSPRQPTVASASPAS